MKLLMEQWRVYINGVDEEEAFYRFLEKTFGKSAGLFGPQIEDVSGDIE